MSNEDDSLINPAGIWVPRVGILEAEIDNGMMGQVSGRYCIQRRKAETDELVQQVEFDNVITDIGLDRIGTAAAGSYCFVGTGTSTPTVSDNGLQSPLAYISGPIENINPLILGVAPLYETTNAQRYRFNAGVAVGNLTEVGIGWFQGAVSLHNHRVFSRARIVDGAGNPITLTVLADEVLDVWYYKTFYPYMGADVVQNVVISGVNYTFTSRHFNLGTNQTLSGNLTSSQGAGISATGYTGTAVGTPPSLAANTASTGLLTRGGGQSFTVTQNAYVSNSRTASATLSASLTQVNLTYGIRGLEQCASPPGASPSGIMYCWWQTTISPAIPKDNTKVLSFGTSVGWNRY